MFYFFLLGEGEGSPRRRGGGIGFLLKVPGVSERPGACLWRIGESGGGGGLNIFFRGRNVHQDNYGTEILHIKGTTCSKRGVLGHCPKYHFFK